MIIDKKKLFKDIKRIQQKFLNENKELLLFGKLYEYQQNCLQLKGIHLCEIQILKQIK